ncbi:MAG: OB-fold nucleic acid binding domain-containing protein [Bacteroidales bacterium]|nr:OB-fold nucleic acid binding domain-containing protein [Bacteroidales bacterium]
MKKILISLAAILALASCRSLKEEWDPVFTFGGNEPAATKIYNESELRNYGFSGTFTPIHDLKALYKSGGLDITGNRWIRGQVISDDRTGNVYRELYIQDETGGIDLKLGKSSLYSEYKLGQWVYVWCDGLRLGSYNDMPQLGLEPDNTSTNEYETSYIDLQAIIDQHVFKGQYADPIQPAEVGESDLKAALAAGYTGQLWGKLVTIKGMKYGNQIFALFYPNPNMAHKSGNPENRIFLSDSGTWGITTWSCSKAKYIEYLNSGVWDTAEIGSGATRYGAGSILKTPEQINLSQSVLDKFGADAKLTYKEIMIKYATANYVSHYFRIGGTDVQVRTSGYAKFSDIELDPRLRDGSATCDITGILSIYNGAAQFTLVDEPSVSVIVK